MGYDVDMCEAEKLEQIQEVYHESRNLIFEA